MPQRKCLKFEVPNVPKVEKRASKARGQKSDVRGQKSEKPPSQHPAIHSSSIQYPASSIQHPVPRIYYSLTFVPAVCYEPKANQESGIDFSIIQDVGTGMGKEVNGH